MMAWIGTTICLLVGIVTIFIAGGTANLDRPFQIKNDGLATAFFIIGLIALSLALWARP